MEVLRFVGSFKPSAVVLLLLTRDSCLNNLVNNNIIVLQDSIIQVQPFSLVN